MYLSMGGLAFSSTDDPIQSNPTARFSCLALTLTTTATTIPPSACRRMTLHTSALYPWKNPPSATLAASDE